MCKPTSPIYPFSMSLSCLSPVPQLASHLNIELLKLLQVEDAGGTVFEEAFVPLLELCLVKFGVLGQVIQDLWSELAVVFPHDASPLWRRVGERERETG